MTQSNDLSQRVDRTEGQIVDLQLTANLILQAIDINSTDIAQLVEVSRRNSEGVSALLEVSRHHSEAISQNSRSISTLEEAIQDIRDSNASIHATIDHMDRCSTT